MRGPDKNRSRGSVLVIYKEYRAFVEYPSSEIYSLLMVHQYTLVSLIILAIVVKPLIYTYKSNIYFENYELDRE